MAYPLIDSTSRLLNPNRVRAPMRMTGRRMGVGAGRVHRSGTRAFPGEGVRWRCIREQRQQLGFGERLFEEITVVHRQSPARKELLRPPAGGSGAHLVKGDV